MASFTGDHLDSIKAALAGGARELYARCEVTDAAMVCRRLGPDCTGPGGEPLHVNEQDRAYGFQVRAVERSEVPPSGLWVCSGCAGWTVHHTCGRMPCAVSSSGWAWDRAEEEARARLKRELEGEGTPDQVTAALASLEGWDRAMSWVSQEALPAALAALQVRLGVRGGPSVLREVVTPRPGQVVAHTALSGAEARAVAMVTPSEEELRAVYDSGGARWWHTTSAPVPSWYREGVAMMQDEVPEEVRASWRVSERSHAEAARTAEREREEATRKLIGCLRLRMAAVHEGKQGKHALGPALGWLEELEYLVRRSVS